jgi:histidine ammonia-lyase
MTRIILWWRRMRVRSVARKAESLGMFVVSREVAEGIDAETSALYKYVSKSGYLRNVKTGAGKRCERRVTRSASRLRALTSFVIVGHRELSA